VRRNQDDESFGVRIHQCLCHRSGLSGKQRFGDKALARSQTSKNECKALAKTLALFIFDTRLSKSKGAIKSVVRTPAHRLGLDLHHMMEATPQAAPQSFDPAQNGAQLSYYRRRRAMMTPEQIAAFNNHAAALARKRRQRAAMSPAQLKKARSKDRIKYAVRMARNPLDFRAKRCAIQKRYDRRQRRPGVYVNLVF
jgi:hypothetical protein